MNADAFIPQNDLETALVAAATDTAARPHFYKVLTESSVLVVHVGEPPPIVDGVVVQEARLSLPKIEIEGEQCIPFFSSEARLPTGSRYIGLRVLDLLGFTKGSHLVLNPGLTYGKLFLPNEISEILDGSIFEPKEPLTLKKGAKQLIGQPKDYPHELVNALTRFFAKEPSIEKAFLAQHFIVGTHSEPALLIAVMAPQNGFERLAASIGLISRESKKIQTSVDIIKLEASEKGYFSNLQPFYSRKQKGLFNRLFG